MAIETEGGGRSIFFLNDRGTDLRCSRTSLMFALFHHVDDHELLLPQEPAVETAQDPRAEVEPSRSSQRDVPAHLEVQ